MHIYMLNKNKPVVITLDTNPSKLVATDGYHITPPVQITYTPQRRHYYTIKCVIENDVLIGGGLFMLLLFFMGLSSGFIILLLLSITPIFLLLFLYYIKRKEFIQIRRA